MLFPSLFYLFISFFLFIIALAGTFLVKRNLVMIVVSIEVMLLSVQLNFLISSFCFDDLMGQVFILYILMVAAAEVAIGLALFIVYYRLRGSIDTRFIYLSKG